MEDKDQFIKIIQGFLDKKQKEVKENPDNFGDSTEHKFFSRGFEEGSDHAFYSMIDLLSGYEITLKRK